MRIIRVKIIFTRMISFAAAHMTPLRFELANAILASLSPEPYATLLASARIRRGGILASIAALHGILLWAIATVVPEARPILPSSMQVMLIPEKQVPVIAPPVPAVHLAPRLVKLDSNILEIPMPQVEVAREIKAPPQSLVTLATEPTIDTMTTAVVASLQPPVQSMPAPPGPPAAPAPVAVQIAAASPPPVNIPSSAIQYLQLPEVVYPALSRRRRETGLVIVSTLVDKDGRPVHTQVFQSSGFERLDDAAIAAVRKARFKPYYQSGQATAGWARIPISFDLDS